MAQISLNDRARYYRTLAQLVEANVPPEALCDSLARGFKSGPLRQLTDRLRSVLRSGNPVSEAVLQSPELGIPGVHGTIMMAAEKSGHLPMQLKRLAAWDERRQVDLQLVRQKAAYPIAVFHLAVVAPFATLIVTSPSKALFWILAICIPVDLLLLLLYRALASPNPPVTGANFVRLAPPIERMVRDREAASFLGTVGQLYEAGVPILDASRQALAAVRFDDLRDRYRSAVESGSAGTGEFRNVVDAIPLDRPEVTALLITSEPAGELGRALSDASHLLEERSGAAESSFVRMGTRAFYALVVVFTVWRVVAFYAAYYGQFAQLR